MKMAEYGLILTPRKNQPNRLLPFVDDDDYNLFFFCIFLALIFSCEAVLDVRKRKMKYYQIIHDRKLLQIF